MTRTDYKESATQAKVYSFARKGWFIVLFIVWAVLISGLFYKADISKILNKILGLFNII